MDMVSGNILFDAVVCATNSPQLAYWAIHGITRKMSVEEFFDKFNLYDIVKPTIECSLRRQGIPVLAVSKVDLKELVEKILTLTDKLTPMLINYATLILMLTRFINGIPKT